MFSTVGVCQIVIGVRKGGEIRNSYVGCRRFLTQGSVLPLSVSKCLFVSVNVSLTLFLIILPRTVTFLPVTQDVEIIW